MDCCLSFRRRAEDVHETQELSFDETQLTRPSLNLEGLIATICGA